jgi:WS/DGAT/MGAT family acyltransferase
LRLRLEKPAARNGPAYWVRDEALDLDWHLNTEADELDEAAFRAAVGRLMGERLDHERPLWRVDVIPLEGERTGVVTRIHHALADGVTAIRTIGGLLWDTSEPAAPRHAPAPAKPAKAETESEKRARGAGLRHAAKLPAALARELRPGGDSVLDRHIGPSREVAWVGVPLERLKAIGHSAGEGVTVNDVVLAVVAGALRKWLEAAHVKPHGLRAQIPVCLHLQDSSTAIGNRDSFLNVDLPIDEPDAAERLRRINAETSVRKLDHDAETLYKFFHALGHFKPLYRGVTRVTSGPREFALSVSNVPGPRDPVQILGHGVEEFSSFAEPADRHALRVSVVSIGGVLAFGVCSDPEAVPGIDRLAAGIEASIAELEDRV